MTRTDQNTTIFEGTDVRIPWIVTDVATGLPLNLSGATLTWVAVDGGPGGTVAITKVSTDGGIDVTDAAAGACDVVLSKTDTANKGDDGGKSYYQELAIVKSGNSEVGGIGTLTVFQSAIL